MGDIKLSKTFDIVIENGDIGMCNDNESYAQCGRLAIHTRKGSNAFHPELGNNLFNDRVKYTNTATVESYCRDAIYSSSGDIRGIESLTLVAVDNDFNSLDCDFILKMADIEIEEFEELEETEVDIDNPDEEIYDWSDEV